MATLLSATHTTSEAQAQKRLERLACAVEATDVVSARRLRRLKDALSDQEKARQWAGADLFRMIEPDTIVEKYKSHLLPGRVIGVFEWIRNIAILIPIMVTWLGISRAVDAYHSLLNADSTQISQPFLYLWQGRFNGYLKPWGPFDFTLGALATADVFLLLFILGMTAFVTIRSHLVHATREQDAEDIRVQLVDVLADVTLLLEARKQQRPDAVRLLANLVRHFETVSQGFLAELQQERQNRGDMTAFTQAIEHSSSQMLSASQGIQRTSEKLTHAISELLIAMRSLPELQRRLVASTEEALQALRALVASFSTLLTDHNAWRREVRDVLATGLTGLIEQQRRSGESLHYLLDTSLTQLMSQQEKSARLAQETFNTSFRQLIDRQDTWAEKLVMSIDALELLVEQVGKVAHALEGSIKGQGQIVNALENERNEQTNLVDRMISAAKNTADALQAIRAWTPELKSIAVYMKDCVGELKSLPAEIQRELFDALKSYASAAMSVAAGTGDLQGAAHALDQVSRTLADVTLKLDKQLDL